MNRRRLLLLGFTAPLTRLARFLPEWPAELRVFADLKHKGTLTELAAASPPAVTDFGIAVPHGRVITGNQRDLGMHPGVMLFLEAQGIPSGSHKRCNRESSLFF